MSLQAAIERNRQRQADRRVGIKAEPTLRPFKIRITTISPVWMIEAGLAPKLNPGNIIPTEVRTFYGTSLEDAKERNGIQ